MPPNRIGLKYGMRTSAGQTGNSVFFSPLLSCWFFLSASKLDASERSMIVHSSSCVSFAKRNSRAVKRSPACHASSNSNWVYPASNMSLEDRRNWSHFAIYPSGLYLEVSVHKQWGQFWKSKKRIWIWICVVISIRMHCVTSEQGVRLTEKNEDRQCSCFRL